MQNHNCQINFLSDFFTIPIEANPNVDAATEDITHRIEGKQAVTFAHQVTEINKKECV